jgi:hypothetical protein
VAASDGEDSEVPESTAESPMASAIEDELYALPDAVDVEHQDPVAAVKKLLGLDTKRATFLVAESKRLYVDRMRQRFSVLRVAERIKRTNPFLLRIRGAVTVKDWATLQVQSALYASEEEAVGHLLEAIAKICLPGAREPKFPDDFDLESDGPNNEVFGYQVKMSWDCMPMSSRRNLSNTIRRVRQEYSEEGIEFVGYFAPCYGKARTSQPPGQEYITLASKEFWTRVGNGNPDFDVAVGEVCALLCAEFRSEILITLVPELVENLTEAAIPQIGTVDGGIDYKKLFRRVNR